MSVLYIIAVVVLLIVLLVLTVVKNKADADLYAKYHPSKKEQEEFLKACELYLEYYKNPEEHADPAADAKYDAAVYMKEQGLLPLALEDLMVRTGGGGPFSTKPLSHKELMRGDGHPAYMTYDAIRNIRQESFLECRKQDRQLSGYSMDERFWVDDTFKMELWNQYCDSMDDAFNELVDRYNSEIGDGVEKGPRFER